MRRHAGATPDRKPRCGRYEAAKRSAARNGSAIKLHAAIVLALWWWGRHDGTGLFDARSRR